MGQAIRQAAGKGLEAKTSYLRRGDGYQVSTPLPREGLARTASRRASMIVQDVEGNEEEGELDVEVDEQMAGSSWGKRASAWKAPGIQQLQIQIISFYII